MNIQRISRLKFQSMPRKIFLSMAMLLFTFNASLVVAESTPVDQFSVHDYVSDTTVDGSAVTSSVTDATDPGSILGGVRDISADLRLDGIPADPDNGAHMSVDYNFIYATNVLSFSSDTSSAGEGIAQWNAQPGIQDLMTGGYNLSENLWAKGDSFAYEVLELDQPIFQLGIEAYSNSAAFTKVVVDVTGPGQDTIPFAALELAGLCGYTRGAVIPDGVDPALVSVTCGSGNTTPVDMSDVGALQLVINVGAAKPAVDLVMGPITIEGEVPIACRVTAGINDEGIIDEKLFVKGDTEEIYSNEINKWRAGGQAGANTAQQPQPKGEWQHHQKSGPFGKFSFHVGTASAPEGSEIDVVRCSDPLGCYPAGDEKLPSPAKQLDFDGIGAFSNIGKTPKSTPLWLTPDANVSVGSGNKDFDGTFHRVEVNLDDLGEPAANSKKNPLVGTAACPVDGFGEKGSIELAECGCPDFYRITIYNGVDAATPGLKNADGSIDMATMKMHDSDVIIYEVYGYLEGGNIQIHPLTGFDSK